MLASNCGKSVAQICPIRPLFLAPAVARDGSPVAARNWPAASRRLQPFRGVSHL